MLSLKQQYGTVVIANLGGHSEEEYVEGAALLDKSAVDIIELNISCPQREAGGHGLRRQGRCRRRGGADGARSLPQAPDGQAEPPGRGHPRDVQGRRGGRGRRHQPDHTFQACAIDLEKRRPVFDNIFAGLSGPAVRPIALRMVWQRWAPSASRWWAWAASPPAATRWSSSWRALRRSRWARPTLRTPRAMSAVAEEMAAWMDAHGVKDLAEIRGCAR